MYQYECTFLARKSTLSLCLWEKAAEGLPPEDVGTESIALRDKTEADFPGRKENNSRRARQGQETFGAKI